MTFSKSNLNLLPESLFTELTADQTQMLEGGKRITILLVQCIKAGNGSDKLFFTINGQNVQFGRTIDIRTGGVANVGVAENFDGTARVRLFDKNDGSLGSFSASSNGTQTRRVSGGGSTYDVTYRVTN
ncbi:hypothetical protein [Calothrix sp. 336/3]|uniref:hypothetical protein n=1 Tax=Calothrix sp. 336/3 TaxID=1337936 RepID=UPI0004E38304|nr:hypothetical protein [Calothrix sp. 336/3]AKG22292.1 hypothetical protein IJ00_14385 [Calothrix sp. 336/3]